MGRVKQYFSILKNLKQNRQKLGLTRLSVDQRRYSWTFSLENGFPRKTVTLGQGSTITWEKCTGKAGNPECSFFTELKKKIKKKKKTVFFGKSFSLVLSRKTAIFFSSSSHFLLYFFDAKTAIVFFTIFKEDLVQDNIDDQITLPRPKIFRERQNPFDCFNRSQFRSPFRFLVRDFSLYSKN